MYSKILVLLIYMALSYPKAIAQDDVGGVLEQIMESIAQQGREDVDYSELTDHILLLKQHPLDINAVGRDELEAFLFLSDLQITTILEHRGIVGPFQDILELQAYETFDIEIIKWLKVFLRVREAALERQPGQTLLDNAEHELIFRLGRKLGGSAVEDNYFGSPMKLLTRYRGSFNTHYVIRFNAEKDAGELSRIKGGRLFDFYSGNIFYRTAGLVAKLVVGDYALQFGQGLSLWSGLGFGKGSSFLNLAKPESGLKPYTSVNESSFFRGTAVTLSIKRIQVTPFISFKNVDASLNSDGKIKGLSESGLHRTLAELNNKGNLSQFNAGANIQVPYRKLKFGVNSYYTSFTVPFAQRTIPYQKFDYVGERLYNSSVYMKGNAAGNYVFAEFAYNNPSGFAGLAGLMRSVSRTASLALLYRDYKRNYHSFFSNSVAEGSESSNERGFYAGLQYKHSKRWELAGYIDFFQFPWLRYRVDAPSSGYEFFSQVSYNASDGYKISVRYRIQSKEENGNSDALVSTLENVLKQSGRLDFEYKLNDQVTLRYRTELSIYKKDILRETGFLTYADALFKPSKGVLSGNVRLAHSWIPGYNSRIYSYQSDVLYSYSVPAYQGKGFSGYLNVRLQFARGLDLWCRYAVRAVRLNSNGSLEGTARGAEHDLKLQLRIQV